MSEKSSLDLVNNINTFNLFICLLLIFLLNYFNKLTEV